MSVYRDGKTGTWRVIYRYTDYTGERKQTQKRGFMTRREAVAWEHEQVIKTTASLDMTFGSFYERYAADIRPRLKENTWNTKEHIIRTKILPYFQNRKMIEIKSRDIVAWQNELLTCRDKTGKPFSQTYLKTIHNQLSALFNHAMSSMDSEPTRRGRQEIWERKNGRKCSSGRRRSTGSLRMS
ncbi:AP2-like DNA-binding integrase domain-containing protein [Lachnospiraceae bacterium NK3A20]|nr:AP2-like DNA-binding integrase domain-containing protein [Lachnospiraceae bacterium NK3A20]